VSDLKRHRAASVPLRGTAHRHYQPQEIPKFPSLRNRPKIMTLRAFMQKGVVMSKNWIILTGLLFLGSVETSQAHPLDSPDIVYIDGLPCNSACQSYMAWSQRSAPMKPAPAKPVLRSVHTAVHHATAVHRQGSKPAAPRVVKQAVPLPPAKIAKRKPADDAAVHSDPAPANVAASRLADDGTATSQATTTVQEQVTDATASAEPVTAASAAPVLQGEANNAEASLHTEAVHPSDTEPTASAATNNRDNLVALLVARPEIKSVSDLSGRDVAIEDQQSAASASILAAIASTGAVNVRLKEGHMTAINRLFGGEVPAAVLMLVSPETAERFPDIPGFTIFRIPLSPG
jgi:hypothetical protein